MHRVPAAAAGEDRGQRTAGKRPTMGPTRSGFPSTSTASECQLNFERLYRPRGVLRAVVVEVEPLEEEEK